MKSLYLGERAEKGLIKLGTVIIPGDKDLPSFSQLEQLQEIDIMLKELPKDDREGLIILLSILSLLPKFIIKVLLLIIEKGATVNGPIGSPFRLLNMGLKGPVFTLYYSNNSEQNQEILNKLNYATQINMKEEDLMLQKVKNNELIENPNQEQIEEIFNNAKKNQKALRNIPLSSRVKQVQNLLITIRDNEELIIKKIQEDTKKSAGDALVSEFFGVLDYLHFLVDNAEKALKDEKIKTPIALLGKKSRVYYESLGTMLIISPWNYPFYQAIVPIATSYICGNITLYKPSEVTPLRGLIEDLLLKAGIDLDFIKVIYGDGKVGSQLIDQRPDKIFFTGSVNTGKKIMQQAAQYIIPVELELGGKDASIVFEDCNLKRAAKGVAWGALTNLGQSCTSVERIYVHSAVYEAFKTELLNEVRSLKQEISKDGDFGHMTSHMQTKIVAEHVKDALSKNAKLLTGNNWDYESDAIPPLVLEDISEEMLIYNEETFGPVLPLIKFTNEKEVIDDINASDLGLSASLWSKDKAKCDRVTRELNVGNVSVNNVMLTEGNPYLPFGGRKYSGIGTYKGISGIRSFAISKSVLIDADSSKIEVNWYPYTEKKYIGFSLMTKYAFTKGLLNFVKFALKGIGLESYSQKAKR
mgnify:CR=1 FL=1|tara:strand:+ start:127601 stop:129520 length:1920 start_codon:yes stop_codon:yes gene_type:complete